MGRLQHLLLRVRTVVEEADGRYITNSGMVEQLQVLADAMYRGYRLLDSFSCGRPNPLMEEVSNTSALSFRSPPKRCRTITFGRKAKAVSLDQSLDDTLDRLETAVAHMAEFVVLLGGCERLSRRPYDAHLYIDNFMFGRHAEKQRLLNFLLHQNSSAGSPPPVLSVIGDLSVGKRTLVAHVCNDKRVTSHFSLILHLNEGDLFRVEEEHERLAKGKILIVVEFDSGVVDEEDWVKFYSSVTNMKKGSKVVIISKHREFEKIATVEPIFLNTLPYEEFRYLFKILAFGSTNPMEHLQLLRIVDELSKELQLGWSLVTANVLGEALRTNLDVRFWLCMLNKTRRITERNMSVFGAYPKALAERGHHVDMTDLELTPGAPFHLAWTKKAHDDSVKKELPKVTIRELMVDPTARPKGDFIMIIWQSRIPPHTCFGHFVPNCDQGMRQHVLLSGRKRRGVLL
ncbi:putative disease resistance protein RGA3 isoform X1 [Miscanthus floridulus]|uniref:putative disease resistance protein RGA3 isoform X1 n=1 Tax=Miscanthus floridulus TaxID=154761 RepID=UPI003457A664